MSTPQGYLRATIFYEWRRVTGMTETTGKLDSTLEGNRASMRKRSSGGSKDKTRSLKTDFGRDAHKAENSAVLDAVKKDPEVTVLHTTCSLATRIVCLQVPSGPRLHQSAHSMGRLCFGRHHAVYLGSIRQNLPLRPHQKDLWKTCPMDWVLHDSRIVSCGSHEEKTRRRKPIRLFTPRSAAFAASNIGEECCIASCSLKGTQSPAAFTRINFRANGVRKKRPRRASV